MEQGRERGTRDGQGRDDSGCDVFEPAAAAENEEEENIVPPEINDHLRLFGKEPWEVEYGEKCPDCQSRIDEYGFCSCGSHGD